MNKKVNLQKSAILHTRAQPFALSIRNTIFTSPARTSQMNTRDSQSSRPLLRILRRFTAPSLCDSHHIGAGFAGKTRQSAALEPI